jgi:hypothetical protein
MIAVITISPIAAIRNDLIPCLPRSFKSVRSPTHANVSKKTDQEMVTNCEQLRLAEEPTVTRNDQKMTLGSFFH